MGIRYFAKAVTAARVNDASNDPMLSVCCCPDTDSWDEPRDRLPTLDLDKAWRDIQVMLGAESSWDTHAGVRPAAELVRGYSNGMAPYRRLLSPDEVDAAAEDLKLFFEETGRNADGPDPEDYVEHYLQKAHRFASDVAGTGLWVYYAIG
ncbi:hypothetical protein [Microbacterium sp.]|uniref:hypothetical protein n=1 Tax=Microbacterium sp. TaxID=51671 RepID=UPI003A94A2A1